MAIEMVKIRAKITVGSLTVQTPFIRSFNVNKARGQISTFSAVLKVPHDTLSDSMTGGSVIIEAGVDSPGNKIFTGMVKQAKISPCWDDPYYVDLSISGVDRLFQLQGKKFTRRCRSSKSSWVSIMGVARPGLKSGKFKYVEDPILEITPDDPVHSGHIPHARNVTLSDPLTAPLPKPIPIIPKNVAMESGGEEGG